MSTNQKLSRDERLRQYDREMLRSTFVSIFWGAITERRKQGKFTLQSLADKLGIDKSTVSRWFSGESQNWETDTISDISGALDLELEITARERSNPSVIITASGPSVAVHTSTIPQPAVRTTDILTESKQGIEQPLKVTRRPKGIEPEVKAFLSEAA